MSDKKNIIISALIFVLFFLFFPLKIVPNLNYISNESTELLDETNNIPTNKIPYIYKKRAGYYSLDLKNTWGISIGDGVALLSDTYVNTVRDKSIIEIRDLNGNIKYSLEDQGYAFSLNDKLYIIDRDRKSLSQIEFGQKKWTKHFNHIITSIKGGNNYIVLGFVRGFFTVLDNSGKTFFTYEPGGSRVPIIYSVEISNDDNYIATVSGLDPQRFILYEKKDSEYKPIYAINLNYEVRKSQKIFITSNNKDIFVQSYNGYYIINIETKETTFIESNYSLKNVQYIPDLDVYMIHSGAVNYNNLVFLTMDNRILLEKNFIGESVSINSKNKSIYIVIDNSVVKLDIRL